VVEAGCGRRGLSNQRKEVLRRWTSEKVDSHSKKGKTRPKFVNYYEKKEKMNKREGYLDLNGSAGSRRFRKG